MTVRNLLAAILVLTLSASESARVLTETEKSSLSIRVADFVVATMEKDFEYLADAMPPRVLARYAQARLGEEVSADVARLLFVEDSREIDSQIGTVTEDFSLNLEDAEYKETSDGTPYVVIPSTSTVSTHGEARFEIYSPFLALLDEGRWYLINVGFGGLNGSVKGLYPSFDDVEFQFATRKQL